ncbi:MAG: TlpA disulfide reductase family protein [Gammaproteobacteria bacterium]|nr:TlpA disulfide reductase family protein [Gammaproteobacteria bacterium]
MKTLLSFLGVLTITFGFVERQMMADTSLKPNEFLISGELVDVRDIKSELKDLKVKVSVGNEETGVKELVSGEIRDDKFELQGTIEQPTDVTLSVLRGDDIVNLTQFRLCPNSNTKVEVLSVTVYETVYTDRLKEVALDHLYVYLKGYHHLSNDPERKFTFTGDLSKFGGFHPELTYVWVEGRTDKLDGSTTQRYYGPVLLDKGKFSIEGDLDEPMGVYIYVEDGTHSDRIDFGLTAILEPGVNYEIGTLGDTEEIVVLADREGMHSKLITDWKSDPEYLELLEQQTLALEEHITTMNSVDATNRKLESNTEDNEKPNEKKPTSSFAERNPPSDECKHVDMSSVPNDTDKGLSLPSWQELKYKIQDRRIELLLPYIKNDDDLHLAWLAYELSSLDWSRGNDPVFASFHSDGITVYHSFTYELDKQKIAVLGELATRFSEQFVAVHITPRIESALQRVSLYENNKKLIPGQQAPSFALVAKGGDSVSLQSVLQENELVLVNFWNLWCEPCIDSIPALKEMYSAYHDGGFEIVTIHLNRNTYRGLESLEENEFPWVDVINSNNGDLTGWEATIETSYSRMGLGIVYENIFSAEPHGFLIDSEGCILRRDLSTEELDSVLASRWSEESAE